MTFSNCRMDWLMDSFHFETSDKKELNSYLAALNMVFVPLMCSSDVSRLCVLGPTLDSNPAGLILLFLPQSIKRFSITIC